MRAACTLVALALCLALGTTATAQDPERRVLRGKLGFTQVEGGVWELKEGDTLYDLHGDLKGFKPGDLVEVKGQIRRDLSCFHMRGTIFQVEAIRAARARRPHWLEPALSARIRGKAVPGLRVTYDDLHGLHGGLQLTVDGEGRVTQKAVRFKAGEPKERVDEGDLRQLLRILRDIEVWIQREPERMPAPDESKVRLRVEVGAKQVEIWEWYNDLEQNQRIHKVRAFMQKVAWVSKKPTEADYEGVAKRIFDRVVGLKNEHPALQGLEAPRIREGGDSRLAFEHGVTYEKVEVPSGKKGTARRPVYDEDGVSLRLTFYRGAWTGAAMFEPTSFGDLHLWVDVHAGAGDSAQAITREVVEIVRAEKAAFDGRFPGLSSD